MKIAGRKHLEPIAINAVTATPARAAGAIVMDDQGHLAEGTIALTRCRHRSLCIVGQCAGRHAVYSAFIQHQSEGQLRVLVHGPRLVPELTPQLVLAEKNEAVHRDVLGVFDCL